MIVISLPFTEASIVTKPLYDESFAIVMPEGHPLSRQKNVKESDLSDYNLLLLEEKHCFRDQVISSCPSCFVVKPREAMNWRTVSGSSLETVRHMVASGMGLTILPMTAATTQISPYDDRYLIYRPLRGASPNRTVALAWRKTFPRGKAIDVLLKAVSKCALPGSKK